MTRAFVVSSLILLAVIAARAQADILSQLGSNTTEAQQAIFAAFSSGNVYMAGTADVFKTAGDQARVAMVTAVVNLARTYSTSADFARRYANFRENQKPRPAEPGPQSADAMQNEMQKGMEEAIRGLEETARTMPQMKKEIDAQIVEMRKQMTAMMADMKGNKDLDEALKQGAAAQAEEHKRRLAEWEKKYPVDPKGLVTSRLREFLELSATVDFAAKVTKTAAKNAKLKFDNPAYEQKSSQWKYMYRAGKPAVEAARSLAQDWLKALGG